MTPVYFPFTCIAGSAVRMLRLCFPKTVLYQPSASAMPETVRQAVKDFAQIRIPANEDQEKLAAIAKEYQNWAQLHQGRDLSFFKARQGSVPFFDEFSVQEIRADIRRKKEGKNRADQNPDPLFQARIFLSISQEYDMRQWEIGNHLESLSEMENTLLREIRGDEDEDTDTGPSIRSLIAKEDPGAHMTAERLNAWARLALCDPEIPNLFLTTSTAVMEMVCELIPEAGRVLEVEGISLSPDTAGQWQDALAECLSRIELAENISETETITASENADPASAFSMKVYRVSGTDSCGFLNRFIHPESAQRSEGKNVLIAWVG
ncbi:MAG: hypothetical protein R2941_15520 [Desulfobacterales bacterium]